MSLLSLVSPAVPGLLSTVCAAAIIALARTALAGLHASRAAQLAASTAPVEPPRRLREYTLLRTTGPDGHPVQYTSTRPPGSVITHQIDGHPRDFELTALPLGDGTFAAEPL
ncbi:hypothetical protein GCM10010331_75130 [Streptomyces xanthochromogenes]|uniref:hypothetical protein n=1 Tax=Streptomyces xanthochromogenes TaxID=67384 RepID=UPI001673A892|nr:hypothetical protein [Streptomyces xanthochromogenes]GHB76210.1 hypothetical protein GCM10010331_75130 [Streptomyces xanthochromogenes]